MAVDSETLARFRLIPRAVEEGDNDDEEDDDAADDCKKAWAKAPPRAGVRRPVEGQRRRKGSGELASVDDGRVLRVAAPEHHERPGGAVVGLARRRRGRCGLRCGSDSGCSSCCCS